MAWLVFAIAAIVYGLTVEPTASLWDCPEFIACGYKLEIGHPPGAPVFMLAANLFSQLASDPSHVALMVNLLSALLSAGCIFFLFLTVTHLSEKFFAEQSGIAERIVKSEEFATATLSLPNVITIEACGLVGALAYTFSDTFWFSAVEAEVYAFSSFLTALMYRCPSALSALSSRHVVCGVFPSGKAGHVDGDAKGTHCWRLAGGCHPLWYHSWRGKGWRMV